jgi:DNA-binding response OmpR family regulator
LSRVLILEDNPLIAFDLENIAQEAGHEVVEVCASVAAACRALARPVDVALLDIDVADGQSFEVARQLQRRRIPFTFVTARGRAALPPELKDSAVVDKPYAEPAIRRSLAV